MVLLKTFCNPPIHAYIVAALELEADASHQMEYLVGENCIFCWWDNSCSTLFATNEMDAEIADALCRIPIMRLCQVVNSSSISRIVCHSQRLEWLDCVQRYLFGRDSLLMLIADWLTFIFQIYLHFLIFTHTIVWLNRWRVHNACIRWLTMANNSGLS